MDCLQKKLFEMESKNPSASTDTRKDSLLGRLNRNFRWVGNVPQDEAKYTKPMTETLFDEEYLHGNLSSTYEELRKLPENTKGTLIEDWYGPKKCSLGEAIDTIANINTGCPAIGSRYSVFRLEDGREFHRATFRWGYGWLCICYQAEFTIPSK